MSRLLRLFRILSVGMRFRLYEFIPPLAASRLLGLLTGHLKPQTPSPERAVRLRRALETLGPIFVKFGQMLSTRRDLLPADIADELAKLQDQVPPFDSDEAMREIERSLGRRIEDMFATFERVPVASASIAQVHLGTLADGREVAVKVLRPDVEQAIARDVLLIDTAAALLERVWAEGRRLKPREVVAEFSRHLEEEIDLVLEASNGAQLRRNFEDSPILAVPEMYWDYCSRRVIVMQRMHGIPISQVENMRAAGVDIQAIARAGVEIFFTQVFRDGFFHADMHPGNIFVQPQARRDGTIHSRYIALDFGIMGTLTETDKRYLAQNFLGFFNRDYRRVAQTHLDAGWVPAGTRLDQFEAAIRAVCEPVFDRPLKEIYFGKLLLRLFQTSRRFNVEIQPQLVMLQKTLLNIEGLGRQLDPELDLWKTAKPLLERWMNDQLGWRGLLNTLKREAPYWATTLPQIPRLLHQRLADERLGALEASLERLNAHSARRNRILQATLLAALAAALLWLFLRVP